MAETLVRSDTLQERVLLGPERALKMSHAILGIARMISPGDRERYGIPAVIDQRTVRNILADQYLGKEPTDPDLVEETLRAVSGVTRWFSDNPPVPIR